MRHTKNHWPWHFAYAAYQSNHRNRETQDDSSSHQRTNPGKTFYDAFESRWHGRGGAGFGVRRPLRYLVHRLELDESQTRKMASVLNSLKTERDQSELDEKRTVTAMANLLAEGTPSLADTRAALAGRVRSAEHLQEETAKAVVAISDFLDEDQRGEFVNLLLTGSLSF